jgi:hypothetical protein
LRFRASALQAVSFVSCENDQCEFVGYTGDGPCAKTTMHEGDNYENMTDYTLNVLYVIGFVSMGDGHTEAGRILGLCGLPNDTTMNTRSFHIIEDRIGPYLQELSEEIIRDNLIEEVRLLMQADNTSDYFETWKSSLLEDRFGLTPFRR